MVILIKSKTEFFLRHVIYLTDFGFHYKGVGKLGKSAVMGCFVI